MRISDWSSDVCSSDLWRFLGPDREEVAIRPAGSLRSNSGDAMLPALCAGLGIAILPAFIVRPPLEAGRLETILEEWLPPPLSLHLLDRKSTRLNSSH